MKDGGAAFPHDARDIGLKVSNGMSLRDYFAGQALPGLIVNNSTVDPHVPLSVRAYEIADAMLLTREA